MLLHIYYLFWEEQSTKKRWCEGMIPVLGLEGVKGLTLPR
jgi:hypothetical protein